MRSRLTAIIVYAGVSTLTMLAVSCAPEGNSSAVYDDGTAGAPPPAAEDAINVALGNVPNKNDAAAFKLIAFAPGKDVDPASVKFCFGAKAECVAGQVTTVGAVAVESEGEELFVSEKYVKLSHDLRVTILATDKSGADLTTGVTIVAKGQKPTAPATATATATATGTGTGTGTGTATGTLSSPLTNTNTNTNASTGTATASSRCYKAPNEFVCQVELEIARLTNEKRQASGLAPLAYDSKVGYIARLWSEEQAQRNAISHDWFEQGVWMQKYTAEFNEPSPANAENVAMNTYGGDPTQIAASFVEQWWNSPGHKANMLTGNSNGIGVGFFGSGGAYYATQDFSRR